METLVILDQLPLSITLAVSLVESLGAICSYLVSVPGWSHSLLGKILLSDLDPGYKVKVHPVFTVSQRVKLQFPSCSPV